MTKFMISAAAIALAATIPASAQVLGGGIGGAMGGIGGSVGGRIGTTVDATRSATTAAERARDAQRRAERQAERAARRTARDTERQVARQNEANRRAGLTGSLATSGNIDSRSGTLTAQGTANGSARFDGATMQSRGVEAASRRGLRRVAQTSRGVPVFVRAAVAAPRVVARPVVAHFPVFRSGGYAGGPGVVVIPSAEVGGYMDRQYGDLRRDLEGTGANVIRRGETLVVQLPADVTFAFDKSDIQPRFFGSLNAVARTLNSYGATDVEIVGHTDSVGSEEYNLALSERRGRSVADYLVYRAAEPSRLVVEAAGEAEPVASNASVQGRAANRRVEIVLHPRSV